MGKSSAYMCIALSGRIRRRDMVSWLYLGWLVFMTIRSVFSINFNCMIINFLVTAYTLLIYKGHQNSISNKTILFISGIVAWIPLLLCILTGIFFTYALFIRDKLLNEKENISSI